MFGGSRRHRQPNQPLTAATANPNAATAAASAFARRASSSSLSSAAAAAALRSRPTTPINVAEVQTKRTQRRSASVSSHGSQDTRRGLHRSPSQSSMTERTFRSPSPHRAPMTPEDAPPVPTIPDDVRSIMSQSPSHKRATSLQMQPFRVASQKKQEGAGSWFGAAAEGNMANVRTSDALMRVASPESRPGAVSPPSSINFSYPRMPGASPAVSSTVESMTMTVSQRLASPRRPESVNSRTTITSDQSLVYDPNSRRMVPKVDLLAREPSVREAAERPVQKRKKKQQQQGLARSGSHLAKGTVGRVQGSAVVSVGSTPLPAPRQQQQPQVRALTGAPVQKTLQDKPQSKETAVQISVPREAPEPASAPVQASARAPVVSGRSSATVDVGPAYQHSSSSPEVEQPVVQDVRESDGVSILPHSEPRQGAPILGRKPSTVQEESEDELANSEDDAELGQESPTHREVADILRAVPVRSSAPPKQPSLSSESTAVESPVNVSSQTQPSPSQQKQHGSVRNARAQSASPARSARFALGADQLVIRHEPPPRSVSPRKSAMKHSTSPSRGASPSDESSEASGPSHFGSEVTAAEVPMPRKKSVRVSFDDENTKVVGQSTAILELDSSAPPSPQQTKRHWYNHLGRNRKKDAVALDDDEIMKPRPALPSFGSVREKKLRDAEEERPLVRPLESPLLSDPNTPERNQDRAVPNGQSSDYNIGTILSQEQTARNAANISRFREPLPPVVTSLEGSGYYSPTGTDTNDEGDEVFQDPEIIQESEPTLPPEQVKEEIIAAHPKLTDDTLLPPMQAVLAPDKSIGRDRREEDIPSISVIQPTPTPRETAGNGSTDFSEQGYFDVPGGFPEDDSEDSVSHPRTQSELTAVTKDRHQKQMTVSNGAPTPPAELASQPVPTEETESEGASIYSDAYEDLSDVDGEGFMSLDAVVASPVPNKASHKLYQKPMADPSQQTPVTSHISNISQDVRDFSQLSGSSQQPEDEWEKAKIYWRGLTSDKRKQLEQEAVEEAGAEGDLEEVVQPVKAKRKKSVRKSDSAIQQQVSVNPERVYQIEPGTVVIDEGDEENPPATILKTLRGRQSQQTGPANGRLQKTMRGGQTPISAAPGTGMRKTLRSDTPSARSSQPPEPPITGGMRKSMRQSGSSQVGLASAAGSRPVSLQGPPPSQDQDTRPKHLSMDNPMSSVEMARAMQATLRRRASDSSESSFRRARPKQEGLGFRKSMRATTETDPSAAGRNSRFSLRPMDPPASTVSSPVSIGNRTTMRGTLRSDSSDGSTRRMRLPTFGKSSSKKAAGKPSKSRFGDSSDEEDAGPSGFRSRFADSSDEDKSTATATASSGMPKNTGALSSAAAAAMKDPPPHYKAKAEESPDLPDGEAVPPPPVQQKPLSPRKVSGASGRLVKSQSDGPGLQRSGSGRDALVESSTTPSVGTQVMSRPGSHQRRGSFLSVLRRKKESDMGKISRPIASESGARPDTKFERSASEISALRGTNTSPKLQKQSMHDNWPLSEETIDDEKRPMTADNSKPTDASRPVFMKRRSTNQVLTSGLPEDREDNVLVDGSGKKKKKFGTLRRMFKLDD